MDKFDVLVIGGGPGGYIAAIRAAQLGLKTACVDGFIRNDKYSLGGTCLNVGCIPSKALLQSSENFYEVTHSFEDHGIQCDKVSMDIGKMLSRKNNIVDKNASGIEFLFKKNKIIRLQGMASFEAKTDDFWLVNIKDKDNLTKVSAKHVIIATGSLPRQLPNLAIDNNLVLDNQGALDLAQVPEQLCIIGAGVIGIEMGSVWARLGSKVTILEMATKFLASADEDVAKELLKNLQAQGLQIQIGVKLGDIKIQDNKVMLKYEQNEEAKEISCDKVIVAIGRVPNTTNLAADKIGLEIDERGFIEVDENCRTKLANIWAIGDCVRGPMLAHKASEEGVIVAERIAGEKPHFDFNTIPWVIYTNPEVSWVGQTEAQLREVNRSYKVGMASFKANGRALGLGHSIGFVKILACDKTDRILGVHMIGPFVSELITEAVVAMEFKASSEDLARIIHAHPSLSEVIHEAALACDKRQLHG